MEILKKLDNESYLWKQNSVCEELSCMDKSYLKASHRAKLKNISYLLTQKTVFIRRQIYSQANDFYSVQKAD